MNKQDALNLADDLQIAATKIIKNQQALDANRIYELIDALEVLDNPVVDYFAMKQEQYYETESDKKLTLQNLDQNLSELQDRILTNHVDGYVQNDDINLTYNHENPYESGKYSRQIDFHVLSYSLKVVTALVAVVGLDDIKKYLSKDAVLSIGLAAYNLAKNV